MRAAAKLEVLMAAAASLVLLLGACDEDADVPPPGEGIADGSVPDEGPDPSRARVLGGDTAGPAGIVGDAERPASDDDPPPEDTGSEQGSCDAECVDVTQCAEGLTCLDFADGRRCAPRECVDCEHGCVFDRSDCSFTHCTSSPNLRNTCGGICQDTRDCTSNEICLDVFGLGECAPLACLACDGICDYDALTCEFLFCYRDDGSRPVPVSDYCPHVF
jgi:hypothetical protein